jgi:hypothetical protein
MCTVQTAHDVPRSLDHPSTEYPTYVTIPDPLHQVSYSCHDAVAPGVTVPSWVYVSRRLRCAHLNSFLLLNITTSLHSQMLTISIFFPCWSYCVRFLRTRSLAAPLYQAMYFVPLFHASLLGTIGYVVSRD